MSEHTASRSEDIESAGAVSEGSSKVIVNLGPSSDEPSSDEPSSKVIVNLGDGPQVDAALPAIVMVPALPASPAPESPVPVLLSPFPLASDIAGAPAPLHSVPPESDSTPPLVTVRLQSLLVPRSEAVWPALDPSAVTPPPEAVRPALDSSAVTPPPEAARAALDSSAVTPPLVAVKAALEPPAVTPPPVVRHPLPAAAEHPFSEMMEQWLAAGEVAPAPEGAAPGEIASPADDPDARPPSWREAPSDVRRLRLLVGAAVFASLAIVVTMRLYSRHPATEATGAPTIAARTLPAAATATPVSTLAILAGAGAAPRRAPAPPAEPAGSGSAAAAREAGHRHARARPARRAPPDRLRTCKDALSRDHGRHALEACQAATAAAPHSATAVVMLAQANYMAGRRQDTLYLARRAVAIDPRLPDAYLLIGTVEQSVGHSRDAKAAYESYLRLSPRGRRAAEIRAALRTL
jgi:hypothetical protein